MAGTWNASWPPGFSPAVSRARSDSWSSIQCRAAFEKIRSYSSRAANDSIVPSSKWRRESGDSAARAASSMRADRIEADGLGGVQGIVQHAGQMARAAAQVDDPHRRRRPDQREQIDERLLAFPPESFV